MKTGIVQRTQAEAPRNFEEVVSKLSGYIEAKREQPSGPESGERLASIIREVWMVYDGTRYSLLQNSDPGLRPNLYEIAEPLARVIALLEHEGNWPDVLVGLGAPATLAMSPDQEAVERATERHKELLCRLRDIQRIIPRPPVSAGRGRPSKTKDLRSLVNELVAFWERETKKDFKQSWVKFKNTWLPKRGTGTAFVYDIVELIDCDRLPELRTITEDIVRERRRFSA